MIERRLTLTDALAIKTHITTIQQRNRSTSESDILSLTQQVRLGLPRSFKNALESFYASYPPETALLIRGLPVNRPDGLTKLDADSELILAGVTSVLGSAYMAPNHRNAQIFLDLVPRREDAGKQLGTGTSLEWHTEDAHLSQSCRFICLLGLRGDADAKTLISTVRLDALEASLFRRLTTDHCTISSDGSYRIAHQECTSTISRGANGSYRLRYDPEFTTYGTNEDHLAALQLKTLFDKEHQEVTLLTGDLLVINNHTAAHRRSSFAPAYAGSDRWVQRILVA